MSYSTLYGLWPNTTKRVILVQFGNSWGMAPVVWNVMAQKYLGRPPHAWSLGTDHLWRLADRADIDVTDRAVLRMTFDTAYIAAEDVPRAIDDIALFLHAHRALIDTAAANHWPALAWHLVAVRADPPPVFGIQQTSVSQNPWAGPYNEKTDSEDPFDWSTAYSVYDGLPPR